MQALLALIIGCLYTSGVYLMLRRSLFKLILGLILLSHGANLLIFTAAGLTRAVPPIIPEDQTELSGSAADPIPQALILTAIVISFGVVAFALVLFQRTYHAIGTDDPDEMQVDEP
jgi:multicomponent Na+:H+ antiporter subunit C